MSGYKVQIMKKTALQFLKDAKRDLEEGGYNNAIFYTEEAVQLYIKAVLFELFATEIRSHDLRSLLSSLSLSLEESGYTRFSQEIKDLTRIYRNALIDLEDAYIDSRYGGIEYSKEQVEELIEIAEKIINKLEEISKNVKLGKE
ncbi:HEPN domain-containing protein [Sulfurisphaera javensis]|uniref:HEPN domain-containing protein n=1 Tax=Sulfurisphaera javensis TaxID=2049879 RepID=A0AAT9GTQ3_9CREN